MWRLVARDLDQFAKQMGRADGQQAASRFHVHPALGWREAKQERQQQARVAEAERLARATREKIAKREKLVREMTQRREERDQAAGYWQKAKAGQERDAARAISTGGYGRHGRSQKGKGQSCAIAPRAWDGSIPPSILHASA